MTSKERILAAWNGKASDHVPLTIWAFGLSAHRSRLWERNGKPVTHWFSNRMEHIHTLPGAWTLEDDFNRARALLSLGIDDVLDVSVPWGTDPEVTWKDALLPPSGGEKYHVMVREYLTPAGKISHAVRRTDEEQNPGWVVQPDHVPLIEDFNIPRAVRHLVAEPADVDKLAYLYTVPGKQEELWFHERMTRVKAFAESVSVPVQAWTAFGMDAAVWFCGTEKAVLLALDEPEPFARLIDVITEADAGRTALAASHPGVDMVVERGWYSSTDFWSPSLFKEFMVPHIRTIAETAHRYGKKFAYVMTTGVEVLGPLLADCGVDVLYFVDPLDPIQKGLSLVKARELLGDRMTLVGGLSSLTLNTCDAVRIDGEVSHAMEVLGPTNRFILHPVDALFPDTPWEGIEFMIKSWKKR